MSTNRLSSLTDDSYYSNASSARLHDEHSTSNTAGWSTANTSANSRPKKKASLARIVVPSFAAFRSQLPSQPSSAFAKSPRAVSVSLSQPSPRLVAPEARPLSLSGNPVTQERYQIHGRLAPAFEERTEREGDHSDITEQTLHYRDLSLDSHIASSDPSSTYSPRSDSLGALTRWANVLEPSSRQSDIHSVSSTDRSAQYATTQHDSSTTAPMNARKAPTMTLQPFDGVKRTLSDESLQEPPKSPIGRLGGLFGWKAPTPKSEGDSSPTTTFSDRSLSPLPSPRVGTQVMDASHPNAHLGLPNLDIPKGLSDHGYYGNGDSLPMLGSNASLVHVRELERELAHISQELAGSIRREMELEDELDRVRAEFPAGHQSDSTSHRTSDYFSDSGASSVRFPITDVDAKVEQLEKQVRRVEQEKANLKNEAASRLQAELGRRRELEDIIKDLQDQLEKQTPSSTLEEKITELEYTLDETKRRLGQEKEAKENFEDLYSATREELEKHRYAPRFGRDSIAEEGSGLARTGSLAGKSGLKRGTSLRDGRQRSGSNSHADGFKEIEDQRDALHKALKLLIRRHEKQNREHERAIKVLTTAKTRAELVSPNRSAYSKEVTFLKEEVSTLRKRTEDALEQKWEYEKGLSGLKMDLDAAEQETRGLRVLLKGKDINQHNRTPTGSDSGLDDRPEDRLQVSITMAENERDQARKRAAEYRNRAQASKNGRSKDLLDSAHHMDELAEQLGKQVDANVALRSRLAQAVAKGEQEQKRSTQQIEEMQKRLAGMEDSVLAAQQHSETTLATHETEVRRIEDATSPRLQRLRIDVAQANNPNTKSFPTSPALLKPSPRLLSKKLSETSLLERSRTQMLERKVKELEALLREAEEDVQTVVARVNRSQMEVADLQTERDATLTQMHKLQGLVVQERVRAEALM